MWNSGEFIGGLRWRIALARGVHSLAICLAAGCGVGILGMPMIWWWGKSGIEFSLAMLALGGLVGITWGFMRRPSRMEAAVEADRQLRLDDLLGTIESIRDSEWKNALLAYAQDRCRLVKPGDVKVHRVGFRLWGGVGVLAALLLTFGWFGARLPSDVSAAPAALLASSAGIDESLGTNAQAEESRPPGPGGSDVSIRSLDGDRADDSVGQAVLGQNDSSHSAGMNASVGSGAAVKPMHEQTRSRTVGAGSGGANDRGDLAEGTGGSDIHARAMGANASTTSAALGKLAAAPWDSKSWGSDGKQALKADWVPAEDADLVSEYFSR